MALSTLLNIVNTQTLYDADLRYCLIKSDKLPYKIDGSLAKPNNIDDFVQIDVLLDCLNLNDYDGVGISIQASNVSAIDVDSCFSKPFDIDSADERATDILNLFSKLAYCEFSYSGKGLRLIFKHSMIDNYSEKYYIKHSKHKVEFYQPSRSFRYVTLTGRPIFNNPIESSEDLERTLLVFLNKYMLRGKRITRVNPVNNSDKSYTELLELLKYHYLTNIAFQDVWFSNAPGSGKDESEKDYYLLAYLYENITQDKEMLRKLFETSQFFKTKDAQHVYKWKQSEYRYLSYIYEQLSSK